MGRKISPNIQLRHKFSELKALSHSGPEFNILVQMVFIVGRWWAKHFVNVFVWYLSIYLVSTTRLHSRVSSYKFHFFSFIWWWLKMIELHFHLDIHKDIFCVFFPLFCLVFKWFYFWIIFLLLFLFVLIWFDYYWKYY